MFILQNMAEQGSGIIKLDGNYPPYASPVVVEGQGSVDPPVVWNQLQVAPQVAANFFTGTLMNTIGFSIGKFLALVEDVYGASDTVLYWKLIYIWECCELKARISLSHGGSMFGDIKIKWLQALDWWVTYLKLRGKDIDINHFNGDIKSDSIEE